MKIITGMHRSGTSMMARLCYEAGGDLGDPSTFYEGDKWNPDGYFEQPDIHRINIPLVNGPWGKLSYFKLPSTKTILKRAEDKADLIRITSANYQGKIIKETRYCLTLPGWIEHGANIQKLLICLRSPIQVAKSIQKRNKTTLRHGLELWYIHNKRLLENAGNIPLRFVSYNDLLNEKTSFRELKTALEFLELDLSDKEINDLKKKYIKTSMNHNPDLEYVYPKKIQQLWGELQALHSAQFENIKP